MSELWPESLLGRIVFCICVAIPLLFLFAVFFMPAGIGCGSHWVVVEGRLIDAETGKPIVGAEIGTLWSHKVTEEDVAERKAFDAGLIHLTICGELNQVNRLFRRLNDPIHISFIYSYLFIVNIY